MNYVAVVSATRGTTTFRHESPPPGQDHKPGGTSTQARAKMTSSQPYTWLNSGGDHREFLTSLTAAGLINANCSPAVVVVPPVSLSLIIIFLYLKNIYIDSLWWGPPRTRWALGGVRGAVVMFGVYGKLSNP